jgi:ferredoxin
MNEYTTHLLCYGKGADMVFSSTATPQWPGSPFSTPGRSDGNIILAGGFPAIHPDSPFLLSPTLQLNGDLSNCSDADMAAIGRAEFIRSNSQSFRSYVLEADPRVTVLGTERDTLSDFIDRYSGILDIEPLLLETYDSNFTTVHDLEIISRTGDDYQLSFTVKQPVDLKKCTYCGACGPVCPEHCLSERLYLNFSRCSLCNECVNVCSNQAIDLHALEKRILLAPAILLLNGTRVNLPRSSDKIYAEKDLNRLFASIYTARVEEVISCNRNICQYSVKLDTGCKICRTACTHGAVSHNRDDGIRINHLLCTECGACLTSCPTGALQYGRFSDTSFVEYFRTVTLKRNATVVLAGEQDLHRFWWRTKREEFDPAFFLEYPQPMALSSMHLFLLYCMGAGRIIVSGKDNKESVSIRHQINLVNTVLNTLFGVDDPILLIEHHLLSAELEKNSVKNPLTTLYHDFSFTNRREKLADILSFLCRQSETKAVRLTGGAVADFGEIICDRDKCTLCSACVGECRIAALTADSSSFSLNHSPALCVQCGTCVDLCPEEALVLQPGLSLHPDFFATTSLARAEPVKCLECGKIFGTRESLAKIMTILVEKNMWDSDDNLLNYCETCRVVKLFESHKK